MDNEGFMVSFMGTINCISELSNDLMGHFKRVLIGQLDGYSSLV